MVLRLSRRIHVSADLASASAAVLDVLVDRAQEAVAERGRFRWVISGGRTPRTLYTLLAGERSREMPWRDTEVYFADERCVRPSDPESNFGAAWASFLGRVPIPRRRVHRIPGEVRPIVEAARRYARILGPLPDVGAGEVPRFDVVLLGIGPDGHTASLFPGQPSGRELRRSVVAVRSAGQPPRVPRITLTLPALSNTRYAGFLVAGGDKRDALARIFRAGPNGDPSLPASRVSPPTPVDWFLDAAAASGLRAVRSGRDSRGR